MPTIGYRNPKEIRYLIQGLRPVNVSNERELGKVGKDEIVILSSTVGMKKRIEIAKKYSGKGIKFMNFNPEKLLIEIKKNEPKENKEGEKK
jgi:large subunit ribosomal protein L32e